VKSPEAFCRIRGRLHCGEERIEIKSKEEEIINSTPSAESGPPHPCKAVAHTCWLVTYRA